MNNSGHLVAVFGGAVSGSEAAFQLAQHGIRSVVFDQNALPYGKIEDGLPKWHVKLRDKEENKIDEKLSHPLVTYVPFAGLGKEIDFNELANNWGFSAVILAIGAWKDRPLPLEGIDAYIDKGLVYQNPFIYWFNHKHEPEYKGPQFEVEDNAIVVGGGLASIDVVKVLMFETVGKALRDRGHDVNLFSMERGINKLLDKLDLTKEALGVNGCHLFYRRRVQDMPLSPIVTDTPEKKEKAQRVATKILNNALTKYQFHMHSNHVPIDFSTTAGRLSGIIFQKTEIVEGRVKKLEGSEYEVKGSMVISSIGSIPEPIQGLPSKGSVYAIDQSACCRLEGYDNVFAVGNTVTGRGNINESLQHGREVTQAIIQRYLQLGDAAKIEAGLREAESEVGKNIQSVHSALKQIPALSPDQLNSLESRILALQEKAGYSGDYAGWRAKWLPMRLEDMLGINH